MEALSNSEILDSKLVFHNLHVMAFQNKFSVQLSLDSVHFRCSLVLDYN